MPVGQFRKAGELALERIAMIKNVNKLKNIEGQSRVGGLCWGVGVTWIEPSGWSMVGESRVGGLW